MVTNRKQSNKYTEQKTKTTKKDKSIDSKKKKEKKIGIDKDNSTFLNYFESIASGDLAVGCDPSLNGHCIVTVGRYADKCFSYLFTNFSKIDKKEYEKDKKDATAVLENYKGKLVKNDRYAMMEKQAVLDGLKNTELKKIQSSIRYLHSGMDKFLLVTLDYLSSETRLYETIEHPFYNRFNPKAYSDQIKVYQATLNELIGDCTEVEPKTVKKFITGNGSATKEDMFNALEMHPFTKKILQTRLFIDASKNNLVKEGIVDAISIAIFGYFTRKTIENVLKK